jgi:hypothetical protein
MKAILDIIFKYVVDGKQIVKKRDDNNKVTGYSFRSLDLDSLLVDEGLVSAMKANEDKRELNFRYGKKGSNWVDTKDNNKVHPIHRDFFYVGYDTRTEYTSASQLMED